MPILVMKDRKTKRIGATFVQAKGQDAYAIKFGQSFLESTGYRQIVNKSDGEHAIVALKRRCAEEARIEMHLARLRDQEVRIADRIVRFREGETIHTRNSHKFTADGLSSLAGSAGWRVEPMLSDPERLFAVAVLRPA